MTKVNLINFAEAWAKARASRVKNHRTELQIDYINCYN